MSAAGLLRAAPTEACRPWPRHVLTPEEWRAFAASLAAEPTLALLALWADTIRIHALFHDRQSGDFIPASVPVVSGRYAPLSPHRPAAAWFERMIADLWGHRPEDAPDPRPWLDHGKWPTTAPLSSRPLPRGGPPEPPEFLESEGDDLSQIPVGPIHAGIIEPGHFRFTVSGETIVRLETRLGYAHKGALQLMRGKTPRAAARFAARLSGDTTVAHSIAFARATEAAAGTEAPPRAAALRGLMGELERIANHLGDCGAIAGDASFAYLPTRFTLHREAILRAGAAAFAHRLMMDIVIPGGVALDIAPAGADAILPALAAIEAELPDLVGIYDNHASLTDRMVGTGIVSRDLAGRLAAGGVVGRASGRAADLRLHPGYPPFETLKPSAVTRAEGDVDARMRVRFAEITDSLRLVRALLAALPEGAVSVPLPMASGEGIGWAEGFRGDIWHWLRLDGGLIASVFMRDPSWLHWPLLEQAIRGNIVADFPLINRSINASYSGVDL